MQRQVLEMTRRAQERTAEFRGQRRDGMGDEEQDEHPACSGDLLHRHADQPDLRRCQRKILVAANEDAAEQRRYRIVFQVVEVGRPAGPKGMHLRGRQTMQNPGHRAESDEETQGDRDVTKAGHEYQQRAQAAGQLIAPRWVWWCAAQGAHRTDPGTTSSATAARLRDRPSPDPTAARGAAMMAP